MKKKLKLDIRCGDILDQIKQIPDESVDLIVTDPPYNLSKNYGNTHDTFEFAEYLNFTEAWMKEADRVLKPDGTIYIFMGMRYISYVYNYLDSQLKYHFNSWIAWYYTQGIGKTIGFSPRHDDILMFTKSKKFTFNLDDIRIPQKYYRSVNNMRGANPGNVWEFSHMHYCSRHRLEHPTQKPEGLYERIILASTNEGDTVLDPFVGSGTALRVCQNTGRNCIGIDINPEYVKMCKERLKKPFEGFDSIDDRMTRVPNDLNDPAYRAEYIQNHISWFLKYHEGAVPEFLKEVRNKYGDKMERDGQMELLCELEAKYRKKGKK